jgi:protein TonB
VDDPVRPVTETVAPRSFGLAVALSFALHLVLLAVAFWSIKPLPVTELPRLAAENAFTVDLIAFPTSAAQRPEGRDSQAALIRAVRPLAEAPPVKAAAPKNMPPPVVAPAAVQRGPVDTPPAPDGEFAAAAAVPSPPEPALQGRAGEGEGSTILTGSGPPAPLFGIPIARPQYDTNPPIPYPPAARRANLEGTVLLEALVTAQGTVAQVRLARSSGHAILDRGAVEAVRGWRFEPARRGETAIEMWVEVPVRYRLE